MLLSCSLVRRGLEWLASFIRWAMFLLVLIMLGLCLRVAC